MFEKLARLFARWFECQVEKLVRHLARWHAKLNTDTLYGTLPRFMVRWHVKIRSWNAFGTLAHKPRWHVITLVRKPRWHASMSAST